MTERKNNTLKAKVTSLSRKIKDPAQRTVHVIDESDALEAARKWEVGLRQVYIEALGEGIWPVRYMRNTTSITSDEQQKLAKSCVAVVGAGGLGGNVLMLLARMGIGILNIADPDSFSESNLNRQLAAATETLGCNKAEAAKKLLFSVNPAVEVKTFQTRLTLENAPDILEKADAAVDALDNVSSRLELSKSCKRAGIPMVHAAIAGFEGQVMTIFPGDQGLDLVYGNGSQPPSENATPEAIMGVPGITPAILAGLESMEVIKILLGRGRSLKNRMLYVDLENAGFQEFSFDTNQGQT